MVTLIKRLLPSLFREPLAKCQAVRPILNNLATKLDAMVDRINHGQSDGIHEITGFFQLIADVEDTGLVPMALNELARNEKFRTVYDRLDILQAHIRNAGRHSYGMNRTIRGQKVTDENVYLGNVEGYFTKTVAFTKAHRHDTAFYAALNRQATRFMQSHIGPMLTIIHEFDRAMSV